MKRNDEELAGVHCGEDLALKLEGAPCIEI
jgi:hypothetical protein